MSWSLKLYAQTNADIEQVAEYLYDESGGNVQLVARFYLAATDAIDEILENPLVAQRDRLDSNPNHRIWPVTGFESCAYLYQVIGDTVQIEALTHLARDLPRRLREQRRRNG